MGKPSKVLYERATIITALRESNAIESVYDKDSLDQAMLAWEFLMKHDAFTSALICQTHAILMRNQGLRPDECGYFRRRPVYIGEREGLSWENISNAIRLWIGDVERPSPDWKQLHIAFLYIHPFIDGNGRTGRMLMNWMRIKRCGLEPLIIHESEKSWYFTWFRK